MTAAVVKFGVRAVESGQTMTSESDSVLGFFGAELRRARQRAGLTQEQVGDKVGYTGSLISQIETGRRTASQQLAGQLDDLLDTDGAFARLWPLVERLGQGTKGWRSYADREPNATAVLTYESSMIPGLLQTESYARTVIEAVRPTLSPDVVQARVASRLTRQEMLTRDDPPRLWAILGEAVLHVLVGSREVMADELRHVLDMARLPNVTVQVLPYSAGVTPAMGVAFVVAEFRDDGPDALHIDAAPGPNGDHDPEVVAHYRLVFDHLRAHALPEHRSAAMVEARAKELGA